MKFGDAIHTIAQPIAHGLDATIGPGGMGFYHAPIEDCTGCGGRRQFFNDLGDSIYDHFWSNKENTMTEYIVTKQISVEAESPEDAITKMKDGKTINLQVIERPQSQARVIPQPQQPR